MNISIIGTGNFARIIGRSLQEKNNITFGSRNPDLKKEWARQISPTASVRTQREAIQANEIILIALPWPGNIVIDFFKEHATDLAGKIIIDITNVLQADYSPLRFPDHNSGAEKIQSLIPTAKVVKAFNSASGHSKEHRKLKFDNTTVTGFYCGNDEGAKIATARLLSDAGFSPLDAGGLKNAAYLESLGQFMIALAFEQNYGFDVGWVYLVNK